MNRPALNSERFLKAFVTIESYLRRTTGGGESLGFSRLIKIASRSDPAVNRNKEVLLELASLRNVIVHKRRGGQVIAEPNDQAVADIERIAAHVTAPPTVISLFRTEVLTMSVGDAISEGIKPMFDLSYSQVPVYDHARFVGLLTTNTVGRWLGACVGEDISSLADTKIASVLSHTEDDDNNVFVSKGATLFEVLDRFRDYERRGKRLEAILITDNGKRTEKLLGIITIWDLPKIHQTLEQT